MLTRWLHSKWFHVDASQSSFQIFQFYRRITIETLVAVDYIIFLYYITISEIYIYLKISSLQCKPALAVIFVGELRSCLPFFSVHIFLLTIFVSVFILFVPFSARSTVSAVYFFFKIMALHIIVRSLSAICQHIC